jgi:hypothetical protein
MESLLNTVFNSADLKAYRAVADRDSNDLRRFMLRVDFSRVLPISVQTQTPNGVYRFKRSLIS